MGIGGHFIYLLNVIKHLLVFVCFSFLHLRVISTAARILFSCFTFRDNCKAGRANFNSMKRVPYIKNFHDIFLDVNFIDNYFDQDICSIIYFGCFYIFN